MGISKIEIRSLESSMEERLQLEDKLEEIIVHVKNIFVKNKKPDLGKFLKLYNDSAGRIVEKFLEPIKLSFLSRLPDAREPCFFNLSASKIKGTKLVNFSPICSSLTEILPIKTFIFNNAVVASTLLLMRLSDLYVAKESCGFAEWLFHLLQELSNKYYQDCCSSAQSSIIFDYVVYFYTLPSKFRRFPHKLKKKREIFDYEDRIKVARFRLIENLFLKDFIMNTEMSYFDLNKECSDNHRLWLSQTMKFWEEQSSYEEMSEWLRSPHSIIRENPGSEGSTGMVCFAAHIFSELLELGDYLLASVSAWFLVKIFFLLSYLAQESIAASLKSTARILLEFADSLEYGAYLCGERHGPYHETLQKQGSMVHNLLVALEDEEELAACILQLLDEKRCDDELARNLTMPLVKKVAYYDRQSCLLQSHIRPSREDFLDILLYLRLLNPRSTTLALDVILYQHRCLMYRFKYGPSSTRRSTLKVLFKFLILAYPVLRNELFIKNNLKSIYLIDKQFTTAQEDLINFPPLSNRLRNLRCLWRIIHLNAGKKEGKYTSMDVNGNYLYVEEHDKLFLNKTSSIKVQDINVDLNNVVNGESTRCVNGEDTGCNLKDALSVSGGESRWFHGGEGHCVHGADTLNVNREFAHCVNGEVANVLNGEIFDVVNGVDSAVLFKLCTSEVTERYEESSNVIDKDSALANINPDLNTEHTSLLKTSGRVQLLDQSKELTRDVWSIIVSEGMRCVEVIQSADQIITGGGDVDNGGRCRQQRDLLRSKEQVMVVCQNITYDLVNHLPEKKNIPCEIQQLQVLRQNFIDCLGLLIKEAHKTNCQRSVKNLVASLDDIIKLKDMYLRLIKTTENDLEDLVNWMESIESYL